MIEFWLKVWPADITNYTIIEKYSLALKEVVLHYYHLLIQLSQITIIINNLAFSAAATQEKVWTTRMSKNLIIAHWLKIEYRTTKKTELTILQEQVREKEEDNVDLLPISNQQEMINYF